MSTQSIVPVRTVDDATVVFTLLAPVASLGREHREEAQRMGLAESDEVFVSPVEFHTRFSGQLLPKGAYIVGWLDADGYRQVAGTPLPSAEWLAAHATGLQEWSARVALDS